MPKKKLTISVSGMDFGDLESAAKEAARQAQKETHHDRFSVRFKYFDIMIHDGEAYSDYVFSVSYETEW